MHETEPFHGFASSQCIRAKAISHIHSYQVNLNHLKRLIDVPRVPNHFLGGASPRSVTPTLKATPVPKPMPLAWSIIIQFQERLGSEQGHSNADNPTHVPAYAERCNVISYTCHLNGQCTIVPCCIAPLKVVSLRREMAYANSDISTDLAAATPPSGV